MSDLRADIWRVADTLRGPYKRAEFGSVILPFTILRRLECVLEPHREAIARVLATHSSEFLRASTIETETGLLFYNTTNLTLAKIYADPDNRADNLLLYLRSFSSGIDVFERFKMPEQIARLDEAGVLGSVILTFSKFDLSHETVSNAEMGSIFEHLIFMDFEASNAEAGDHYTPRDAIELLVDLLFAGDDETLRGGAIRSILDPTVGTGGMLSVAEEHLHKLNSSAELLLYGQDINPNSYAICRSDMLAKGQDPQNIMLGNTLTDDKFRTERFDYVLSNPPYGVDWKDERQAVEAEHQNGPAGRFEAGLPAVGDGQMLFLLHCIARLRKPSRENPTGGRVGIVLNGSPLVNGGAGSGPSNIRQWLFENDLVEAIVGLPADMFYNTAYPPTCGFWTTTSVQSARARCS